MDVLEQIRGECERYTQAERRVADYCLQSYPRVVFETVAVVAAQSTTSAPTVMRFAAKAGFDGFSDLQRAVRESLEGDWTRALDRLGRGAPRGKPPWPVRCLQADLGNLERTYRQIPPEAFADIVNLLADEGRAVYLIGGEITHGMCLSFAGLLGWLRDDVNVLGTSASRLPSELATIPPRSVLFALHLRRLTQTMRDVIEISARGGCEVIVATNSPTLPLPESVRHVLILHMRGPGGVLDSYTAIASIMNGLAAAVAERRREQLRERFDRFEQTWTEMGVYIE